MKKTNHIESSSIFRQAVLFALIEQAKIDPAPLRTLFHHLSGDALQSNDEKIGWLKDEITFNVFYNSLTKHKFVSCALEFFRNPFKGIEQTQLKIIWQANLNELVYLFARLREEGIIPLHRNPHVLLQENFLDKYEKPIKARSLRTLLEKGIKNSNRVKLIDDIIDAVLSEKIK